MRTARERWSRGSDPVRERGRAPPEEKHTTSTSSFVPVGHKPGLFSDLGGIAGWHAMRIKEMGDDAEAPPMQAKLYSRAMPQCGLTTRRFAGKTTLNPAAAAGPWSL